MTDFPLDLGACMVPDCDWHIEGPESLLGETAFVLGGVMTHLRTHTDEERDEALVVVVDAMAVAALELITRGN